MNKKAIAFGTTLLIMTVIAIGLSLYYFAHNQPQILQNIETSKIISDFELEASRIETYVLQSIQLANAQTLLRLSEKSMIDNNVNCLMYEGRIILNEACMPQNINLGFVEELQKQLSEILDRYPEDLKFSYETNDEKDILKIKIELKQDYKRLNGDLNRNLEFATNFSESTGIYELENIYARIIQAKQQCNSDPACMSQNFGLKKWDVQIIKQESYFLLDLKTKTNYLMTKGGSFVFDKIIVKFAFS